MLAEKQTVLNNLPPAPDPSIVGREKELGEIVKALLDPDIPIVTLVGLAGVGKTALALAVAHYLRKQGKFPGGIVWLNASAVQSLDVWETIRAALDLPSPQAARRHLREHPTLLILDGFDEAMPQQSMEMLAFLDRLPHPSKALVTSRERVELQGKEQVFMIGPLGEEDAARLLMELASYYGVEVSAEDADEIGRMLDGIPLAIRWVLSAYQGRHISLEALKQRLAEGLVEPSIETLLHTSYRRLSEGEKRLFRRLAVFAADVSERTIEHVCQVEGWKDALRQLAVLFLVDVQGNRYRMHPLVRQYALDRLEEAGERFQYEERAAEYFVYLVEATKLGIIDARSLDIKRYITPDTLTTLEAERVNLLHTVQWAYEQSRWELVEDVVQYLDYFLEVRGYWDDALALSELALHAARDIGDRKGEAIALSHLGSVYQLQNRWDEAIAIYEQALGINRELGDRSGEGQAMGNIGNIYARLGRWDEAIALYQENLSISQELGDRHGEAETLHNLGNVYLQQGRWDEAIALYEQSLSIARELDDRRGESRTLNSLGLVHQYQGRYREAITAYEQSLAIDRELGDRHGEARVLGNLGIVYAQQGQVAKALETYEAALHIFRTLGDRYGESQTMANLGNVYQLQGQWTEAIEMYETSLAIKRDLGDRQGEGQTLGNLGNIYAQQGRWDNAIAFYEQSLAIRRELGDRYGEEQTLGNLANLYAQQGRLDEARQLYEHSLELAKDLGDREGVAFSLAQLGRLAEKSEDYVATLRLSFQSLAIFSELGAPAAEVVRSRLARLQERLGEHRFWELCGQAGVKIDPKALGLSIEKPTNQVVYFVNLAAYHEQREDWRAAANAYRQAQGFIDLSEATDNDHRRYAEISHRLGVCLRLDKQWGPAVERQGETFRQFKKLHDFHGQGRAYLEIARAYHAMNSYDLAVLYYRDAYRLFRRGGDLTLAATAKEEVGSLEYYLHILEPAMADWEEAARLYEEAGQPGKVAIIRQNLAQVQTS